MENKLNFTQTFADAFKLGMANAVNLLLTVILYVLTVWIPYLNVGTTIGFFKIVAALSKGEAIDPLSIFSKQNYKGLGDFFLLMGLETAGLGAAGVFFFIPAIVLGIAWKYSMLFFVDKGLSPLKSLSTSYDTTCGEKWRIFFIYAAAGLAVCLVAGIFASIPKVGGVLAFLVLIAAIAFMIGLEAVMYKHFAAKLEAAPAE